jgi:transporter family protein
VGAAGVAIFGRLGLQHVDTVLASALRSVVMTAAMLAVAAGTGSLGQFVSGRIQLDARAWLYVLAAGLCGAGSWIAYFAALKLGPAAPVAALDRLSLPIVFVLAVVMLGENAGWRGWSGLLLVVAGTYLIVLDQTARSAT